MNLTLFYVNLFIHAVGEADVQEYLRTEALAAIQFSVQPGFQSLVDFLENEYLPNLRPGESYQQFNIIIHTPTYHQPFVDIAVSSLPDIGADFYKQCLKFHTSTDMTVSEIHELGLSEVARIELEMMEIVKELGYINITLQEFTEMIRCSRN